MINKAKNNKEIINKIKDNFISFYGDIICNKKYYICLILFSLIAYGFNLFSRTVSMDDMAFEIFGKEQHYAIKIMRWSIYLVAPFINTKEYSPFIGRFFALLLLIVSATLFAFLIYCLNGSKKNVWQYSIIACLFTTYPLINEIWEFSAMNVNLAYNGISFYMCMALSALIYLYFADGYSIISTLISGIILSPVMAGYESVVFFYITIVFIIIYYKNYYDNYSNKTDWLFDGIRYAIPLMVALIIRLIVGKTLISIFGVDASSSFGRSYWLTNGIKGTIINVIYNGWYYLIRGLSYLPITIFDIILVIYFVIVIKDSKQDKMNLLFGMFVIASVFLLSLVQGDFLYYRVAQTVQVFVAFVGGLLCERTHEIEKKNIGKIVIVILLFICLRQSVYLHELLALNNQRSENEAFIAREIGYKIYSEFDKEKIVIFCGEYQLGDFIEEQITINKDSIAGKVESWIRDLTGKDFEGEYQEFVLNNVNSYFNKQMDAFNSQIEIQRYMSYFGFDINVLENLTDAEEDKLKGYYEKIAKEEDMKPLTIKDMGDYILVYLGPTIDRVNKLKY